MSEKVLYIVRGIQGSGKTTHVQTMIDDMSAELGNTVRLAHYENDQYHMNSRGEYKWAASNMDWAIEQCEYDTTKFMEDHVECDRVFVAVSNTFMSLKYYRAYLDAAQELGYDVYIVTSYGDFGNTHNVPDDTMDWNRERVRNGCFGTIDKLIQAEYPDLDITFAEINK